MTNLPRGHNAVMSSRVEPPDSLDYFPTPPWATRALCEHVLPTFSGLPLKAMSAWEPAAGEGHMAEVLKEYFGQVQASDVHDYGRGYSAGSFIGHGADCATWRHVGTARKPDWIITNPPFRLALEFAERAIAETSFGVALLLRSVFIESAERYRFFKGHPLSLVAPFAERVAMTKGRWDPKASTATSYAWFLWVKGHLPFKTHLTIIPPGRKAALTKADDALRFGAAPGSDPVEIEPHLATAVAALEG